jgi:hypothetical protein
MVNTPASASLVVISKYKYVSRHLVKPQPHTSRAGARKVILDGRSLGTVASLATLTHPLELGKHTIRVRLRWFASKTLTFETQTAGPITFEFDIPKTAVSFLKLLFAPTRSISLMQFAR